MQMSEAQQAKGVIKNIRITQSMVGSVYANSGRAAFLHNNNLRNAIPVLVRAASNRAEVSQVPEQKALFEDIRSALSREGSMFCDWIDANQDATEVSKRDRGHGLETALGLCVFFFFEKKKKILRKSVFLHILYFCLLRASV